MASQTQSCENGAITEGFAYLTKTKVGKLKLVSAFLSFLAMCFVTAGINWINHPGTKSSLGSASAALMIIAWLFSVFVIIAAFPTDLTKNPNFSKVDTYGHLASAIMAVVGTGLAVGTDVEAYVYGCTDRGTYKVVLQDKCTSYILWTATVSSYKESTAIMGLKLLHFLVAGVFAIGHAIVSFFIWREAKKPLSTESEASFETPYL